MPIPPASIIFGNSGVMSHLREVVDSVSAAPMPVFIHGDTGTGKEVLANYIHQRSPWRDGPLTKVRCTTIPGSLLEGELFEFEKAASRESFMARTGLIELAHSGTLLLDDISELDLSAQAKLLQFLEGDTLTRAGRRGITTRVICVANCSLKPDLERGSFSEDLFHRISGAIVALPPLRERLDDLPCITEYLLNQFAESLRTRVRPLSSAIYRRLLSYRWPGNIRELENVVRRYALLGTPAAFPDTKTQLHPRRLHARASNAVTTYFSKRGIT